MWIKNSTIPADIKNMEKDKYLILYKFKSSFKNAITTLKNF